MINFLLPFQVHICHSLLNLNQFACHQPRVLVDLGRVATLRVVLTVILGGVKFRQAVLPVLPQLNLAIYFLAKGRQV